MKLIINADDFGITQSANESIMDLAKLGVLSSTTVMTNMPHAGDVMKLLDIANIGIGLHINLTQGKPVSDPQLIPSLVDANGFFLEKAGFEKSIKSGGIKKDDIKTEIKAQFHWLHSRIGERLDHFDSHQGTNKFSIVSDALIDIAKELSLKVGLRVYNKYYFVKNGSSFIIVHPGLSTVTKFGTKRILVEKVIELRTKKLSKHFFHPDGLLLSSTHSAIDSFERLIQYADQPIWPDKTLEIAFHPAKDTIGLPLTKLMDERVREHELLSSKRFVEAIKKFHLLNYADLAKSL